MTGLAVVTTVYPAARGYLESFSASLRAQTDRDFDLVIVNEGCGSLAGPLAELDFVEVQAGATPAANRRRALEAALDGGFEHLVFADADDTFSVDRVAASRAGLAQAPVVFNELLVDGAPTLAPRIAPGAEIGFEDLLDHNCLGLSNTAARAAAVAASARAIRDEAAIVDWPFFTRVLHAGHRARFIADAHTVYRREGASASVLAERDDDAILHALTVKTAHYRALAALDPALAALAGAFEALAAAVAADERRRADYLAACRAAAPAHPLWWELARAPTDPVMERSA